MEVYPNRFVVDSDAYKKFLTVDKDESSFFQRFNIVGSDTGRIRGSVTYPAEGLGVITGAEGGDVIDVDAELMKELGADYVVRARFRVGVHKGAASIERPKTSAVAVSASCRTSLKRGAAPTGRLELDPLRLLISLLSLRFSTLSSRASVARRQMASNSSFANGFCK